MGLFRWWGLGVFAGLVAATAGIWWAFADLWLEAAVEKGGTRLVGARVELDGADLGLFPVRIRLDGLQVTNPRAPMTNAFQAERIAFGLDTAGLVFGRRRIEEVAVEGAAVNAPRATSGALPRRRRPEIAKPVSRFRLPAFEVPSPAEILAKADPEAPKTARALEADATAVRRRLAERVEELPGEAEIRDFRRRAEALREGLEGGLTGLVKGGKEAAALKADMEEAARKIRSLQEAVREGRGELAARLKELRAAPGADARRLAREYGPSPEGLANLAEAFFGPRVAGWIRTGRYWAERLLPHTAPLRDRLGRPGEVTASRPLRGRGLDLHFPSGPAEPRTVVRRIAISGAEATGAGTALAGQVTDLTPQPTLWPRPLQAALRGGRDAEGGEFTLAAVLDHRDPARAVNRLDLDVSGVSTAGWVLAAGTDFPLRLERGTLQAGIDGRWSADSLDLRLEGRVGQARLRANGERTGEIAQALAEAVAGVRSFTLGGRITGSLDNPKLALRSSLADSLRGAVARVGEKRLKGLEESLRKHLAKEIDPYVDGVEERLGQLAALDGRLADRLGELRTLRGGL